MKENIVITYEYKELPEEIKEKIIENLRDINVDYDWWDFIIEDQQNQLKEYGISKADIQFTGFSLQGDGLSFTGTVDLIELMDKTGLSKDYPRFYQLTKDEEIDASAYLTRIDHRYAHSKTVRLEVEYYRYAYDDYADDEELVQQAEQIEEALNEWRLDKCQEFYRQLEKSFEYLCTEEAVIETIEANEYQFTIDGELF